MTSPGAVGAVKPKEKDYLYTVLDSEQRTFLKAANVEEASRTADNCQ
jgi:hypothetical protein